MARLDVTEVLRSPEFMDSSLVVTRRYQTTNVHGRAENTEESANFSGVVTVDRSLQAMRAAQGNAIAGTILVVTRERLTEGQAGRDGDIVTYQNRDYLVTHTDPYTAYGAGFVQAHCELLPFDGGTPVE